MKAVFNFNDVTDRVKKALKIKADYELAERLNMKTTTFNSRKKANSLPYEELLLLSSTENLDFNWVLTGEGGMYREEQRRNPISERRAEAIIEMYEALSDAQQKEILADIENKKRMNELIETVNQLRKKVG
ncbi:MAG: helix-turn-helix domain-containing protein [Methylovulum sp.]|uniref:helix-turn-helix domain-containing protein n=1 Tax=Methylovulum sp. TaxID=1916980 RepID=UPI00261BF578|nr:helix-turn-helix domain-containing protein [Methylovulum sp.]MDD2725396.1 helix-turn-helix domain-containing protein [Methylovulum sp.]MDD5124347.1 helix-turn-helix domain-containing protein [Methylovulum sp.]